MTRPLPDEERQDCELHWFTEGSEEVHTIHVPIGPATFIIGDRWVTVPRGAARTVWVRPDVRPRLATETDVLNENPEGGQ